MTAATAQARGAVPIGAALLLALTLGLTLARTTLWITGNWNGAAR